MTKAVVEIINIVYSQNDVFRFQIYKPEIVKCFLVVYGRFFG